MDTDPYEIALLMAGIGALLAAWIPSFLHRRPLSLPVVLLALGAVMFALPLGLRRFDPREHLELVERATELGVIVSLMGAGLRIDRPFSWRTWSTTWRMLIVAMPVTIILTAFLGGTIGGLSAVSALLLGSCLAPTDPVLASDVQVGEPTLDEPDDDTAEEEVRFTLTSEGGLNDALAFPFVMAAIAIADNGWGLGGWFSHWVTWDLIGRVVIGLVVGFVVGRLLGLIAFRPPGPLSALADGRQGFVAIATLLLAFGSTELLGGYGFLAVFVAAVTLRGSERQHEFHGELHRFSDGTEHLLVVGLLLLFGGSLISVLGGLTWQGVVCAVLVVFAVRPISGHLALIGTSLPSTKRWAIAFFGIRGFGTLYYLAYALGHAQFTGRATLWAIVSLTIVISIVAHGVTATPVMRLVDRASLSRRRRT